MRIAELVAELQKMDQTRVVVIRQRDGSYAPLAGADDNAAYSAENNWSGTVKFQKLDDEHRRRGFVEEDVAQDTDVPCVALWGV